MTRAYERLTESPQTNIDRGSLTHTERIDLRSLSVEGSVGRTADIPASRFQTVYYLEGDEQAAAKKFAEVNADAVAELNLAGRNVLESSLDRELYDLVLDAAGRRTLTKYPTVVSETREDGAVWIIDRERYDTQVDRRYTTSEDGSARIPSETSLRAIFDRFESTIVESDLRGTEIEGDVRQVLDYFRSSVDFDCEPFSDDGELGVRVREE